MKYIITSSVLILTLIYYAFTISPQREVPQTIFIPSINLSDEVVTLKPNIFKVGEITYIQYNVDPNHVGWHDNSAFVGDGNTVLNGHSHSVFQNLYRVRVGDIIVVNGVNFQVDEVLLLKDIGVSQKQRVENGKYLDPTSDIRITLVTCAGENNEYRLIVIAR